MTEVHTLSSSVSVFLFFNLFLYAAQQIIPLTVTVSQCNLRTHTTTNTHWNPHNMFHTHFLSHAQMFDHTFNTFLSVYKNMRYPVDSQCRPCLLVTFVCPCHGGGHCSCRSLVRSVDVYLCVILDWGEMRRNSSEIERANVEACVSACFLSNTQMTLGK